MWLGALLTILALVALFWKFGTTFRQAVLGYVNDHPNRAIPGSPYWSHPGIGLIEPRQDRPNRAT